MWRREVKKVVHAKHGLQKTVLPEWKILLGRAYLQRGVMLLDSEPVESNAQEFLTFRAIQSTPRLFQILQGIAVVCEDEMAILALHVYLKMVIMAVQHRSCNFDPPANFTQARLLP